MKKFYSFVLSLILFFTFSFSSQAQSSFVLDHGYYVIITIESSEPNPFAIGHKTGSKIYDIYNSSGIVVAKFKLTASFTYSSSGLVTCDSTSCSTSIYNRDWQFSHKTSYRSGSKAYGTFTAVFKPNGITTNTISDTIILTCDKYGNLK